MKDIGEPPVLRRQVQRKLAGSETNLKITTQADMPIAENIARSLDPEHAKQEVNDACA